MILRKDLEKERNPMGFGKFAFVYKVNIYDDMMIYINSITE